jgi:hypothetical protein
MMPPKRNDSANGMEILGWATNSSMLLVRTAEWQYGSDAAPGEQVLAIDAGTGMVYQPELKAMLDERKDKQCWFRVLDARCFFASAEFRSVLDGYYAEEFFEASLRAEENTHKLGCPSADNSEHAK